MTPRFEDALDVRPLDNGKDWLVLEAFHYDTNIYVADFLRRISGGSRIEVPKGFITDFASIPRPLWAIVGGPADGRYRKIAVVHDYLYRTMGVATRAQADAILLEGMKVSGCGWWERSIIYSGVRVGGFDSYKGGL